MEARGPEGGEDEAIRFEDLTVDDDLPIIERIVRYTGSQIALQRLVHVKMLAEASHLAGRSATQKILIPMLENLLNDAEAVIRQHVAGQLLHLSLVAMLEDESAVPSWATLQDQPQKPLPYDQFHPDGYDIVIKHVIPYLSEFLSDPEVDVRRAACDSLAGLALQLKPDDVQQHCLPIPLRLAQEKPETPPQGKKRTEAEQRMEELRTTACNLLAEMGGAASEFALSRQQSATWVHEQVLPAILELCRDDSFRVRRSAAQALPRVMGAASLEAAKNDIVPTFEQLSQDEIHRVRKSTGECLVDMSRALMMLAAAAVGEKDDVSAKSFCDMRRQILLPIADRLIQDPHKQVRQGMMQFLGPFMASFYPYQTSALHELLPVSVESDGSHHLGIVAQFFPHASSMVARLNSSQNAILTTPTPVHSSLDPFRIKSITEAQRLFRALPEFIHASRASRLSLQAVVLDRHQNPPAEEDLQAVMEVLLDYFAALSVVNTGDENTDAEMRVYCAYSFPALVLLLGQEHWEGSMRTCFLTLLNPTYGQETEEVIEPPLPVKRCLASSLHTIAHVLGPEIAERDIIPAVQDYFLPDADDSVRLNMIRNFASLLEVLPMEKRKDPFLVWSEVVQGESFLGGRKRSSSNPLVLNWRQRNYLARSLPDLIVLLPPDLLQDHLWPILKILLTDSVNDVRDDALWSVVLIIQHGTCVETVEKSKTIDDAEQFCKDFNSDIVTWVFANILTNPINQQTGKTRPPNFNDRQVFCRICGSLGLALRLSQQSESAVTYEKDPVAILLQKCKSLFQKDKAAFKAIKLGPYRSMSDAEEDTIQTFLVEIMLPRALMMKDDRTSNVRITLMRILQLQPKSIRHLSNVKPVLKALEDESETWTSFGEPAVNDDGDDNNDAAQSTSQQQSSTSPSSRKSKSGKSSKKSKQQQQPSTPETEAPAPAASNDDSSSSSNEDSPTAATATTNADIRTVVFDDGPIGMQLEPTKEDKACRIYGFNDFGNGELSPAQASGLIQIGDVIVSVNGVKVQSYDETIDLLKAGGKRVVCFRTGTEEERYMSDEGSDEEPDEAAAAAAEAAAARQQLLLQQEKKAKREAKKAKKSKKERPAAETPPETAAVEEVAHDDTAAADDDEERKAKAKRLAERKARKEARRAAARNDDASAGGSVGSEGSSGAGDGESMATAGAKKTVKKDRKEKKKSDKKEKSKKEKVKKSDKSSD